MTYESDRDALYLALKDIIGAAAQGDQPYTPDELVELFLPLLDGPDPEGVAP